MKLPSENQIKLLDALGRSEMTGVEIGEAYNRRNKTVIPSGSIYTSLVRLIDGGWITSDKRRGARLYRLSKNGRANLKLAKMALSLRGKE